MNTKAFAIAAFAVFATASSSFAAVSSENPRNSQITGVSVVSADATRIAAKEYPIRQRDDRDAFGWKNGANTG